VPRRRHPGGRGYVRADWLKLEADLRTQILIREARPSEATAYGQKYEIMGPLTGPNGITGLVLTICIVRTGEQIAYLVTLVPQGRL
jgi:hypothetical protein